MSQPEIREDDPARLSPGDAGLKQWAAPELGLQGAQLDASRSLWPFGWKRNSDGELSYHGVPLSSILAGRDSAGNVIGPQVQTPVFLMDTHHFQGACRIFQQAFARQFDNSAQVHYAGKALFSVEIAKLASQAGLGLDTASAGELNIALASGCDPQLIGLHGNAKSPQLLHLALSGGIGRIIVDSLSEVTRLQRVLDELPQAHAVPVMLRLTTGVHAGGHDFIATAHEDQKFGLSLNPATAPGLSGETLPAALDPLDSPAMAAAKLVLSDERLHLQGLHSHIGSQILGLDGFEAAARVVLDFREKLRRETGFLIEEIDLGGGYGVAYTGRDPQPLTLPEIVRGLHETVTRVCTELDQPLPFVSVEPGRSLVAQTVLTIYRVCNVKDQPVAVDEDGAVIYRRYVAVDGGMSDNIRPALYGANYTATLANRQSDADLVACRVVGSHCESGDIVIHDVALPEDLDEGDLLAVPMTGAYGWAMSSNYNWFTRPGVLGLEWREAANPAEADSPDSPESSIPQSEVTSRWLLEPETVDGMLSHFDPGYREYLRAKPTPQTAVLPETETRTS